MSLMNLMMSWIGKNEILTTFFNGMIKGKKVLGSQDIKNQNTCLSLNCLTMSLMKMKKNSLSSTMRSLKKMSLRMKNWRRSLKRMMTKSCLSLKMNKSYLNLKMNLMTRSLKMNKRKMRMRNWSYCCSRKMNLSMSYSSCLSCLNCY